MRRIMALLGMLILLCLGYWLLLPAFADTRLPAAYAEAHPASLAAFTAEPMVEVEPTAAPLFIHPPKEVEPYQRSTLVVSVPQSGRLTVRLSDEYGEEKPLMDDLPVAAGECRIAFDGTSYGGMPLRRGRYELEATLALADGTRMQARETLIVGAPAVKLQYTVPQSDTYYQRQPRAWFADCSVTQKCTVVFEVYSDAAMTQPVTTVRKKITTAGLFRFAWTGKKGERRLPAATYYARMFVSGMAEDAFAFPITIKEGRPPEVTLDETGELLPQSLSDDAVWQAMLSPIAVVDIDGEDHQRIYKEADPQSTVMGRVHGQSQGLHVLEVGERYTRVGAWRHEDGEYVEGYVPTAKLKVVTPNSTYGLLIDKVAQTLTVYEAGKPIAILPVSTGLMAEDKLFRETRAGAFLTTDRLWPFEDGGFQFDYAIRIDGGNLLHQLGYQAKGNKADFAAQEQELGQKASDGCVRLPREGDINAYWLWTHLPYATKVLVLDDPLERAERLAEWS